MKEFEDLKKIINESKTIALVAHISPDGDAIGSLGAMYNFLKEIGKEVYMVIPSRMSKFDFMPGIDEAVERLSLDSIDLLIALDVAEKKRFNMLEEDIYKAKKLAIIDHHVKIKDEGDVQVIIEEAPANCEVVYEFIKYTKHPISKNIAEYIYLGLMTDTGSFNYERTTSNTYRIAAEMIDIGINFTNTCKIMNDTYTENRMKLLAYVINNMKVYFDGKVRISVVDRDIIDKLNATEEDIDSLVNYLRCIENTKVAIYIKPIENNMYKTSIRTEEPIDAAKLAMMFDGGGHKRAAGFNTIDLEKTKKELIKTLERLLESENNGNT